jgi:hypothetical protein
MENTIYLVSYKTNNKWNPIALQSEKRYKSLGFNVRKVKGYNLKENPHIKRYEVVYLNFLEKVVPLLEKETEKEKNLDGYFVSEDDAYLYDTIDFDYLQKRIKKVKNYKNKIIRIGYQKITYNGYIVGTQLIWFPRRKLSQLKEIMENTKPQHFDGFLTKLSSIQVVLLDYDIQIKQKNKYVSEIEHDSLILGRVRTGIKL